MLFVAGSPNGVSPTIVGRWDGAQWTAVGSAQTGQAFSFAAIQQSSSIGAGLFVGGNFSNGCARKWDGQQWTTPGIAPNGIVETVIIFDDGNGPALYAGGRFAQAGGQQVNFIAKWDGANWSSLAGGMGPFDIFSTRVYALAVFDDGSGPAVYAGGTFTTAGGVPANNIAKWNGKSWSTLGGGTNNAVEALAVFDDGTGPALFVGGAFTSADAVPAKRIAKWDGSAWSTLGTGFGNNVVFALMVFNDGTGPALYAGGTFTTVAGQTANRIAVWKRTAPPQDINCDGHVNVNDLLAVINHWGRCPPQPYACAADINGDGTVNVNDLLAVINNWG